MNPAEILDRIVLACASWIVRHKKISGGVVLAMLVAAQGPSIPPYLNVPGTKEAGRSPVWDGAARNFRLMHDPRGHNLLAFGASGTDDQSTGEATGNVIELDSGYSAVWPDGVGEDDTSVGRLGLMLGAGPTHAVGAPTNVAVNQLEATGTPAGSATVAYIAVSITNGAGHSAGSSEAEITTASAAVPTPTAPVLLAGDVVTGAKSIAIYGRNGTDASKRKIAKISGMQTCWRIHCNAPTAFTFADIGDVANQATTSHRGVLVGYINANPANGGNGTIYVHPIEGPDGDSTLDTFNGAGTITVNANTGTPTGAAVNVASWHWLDRGDAYYEGTVDNQGDDWANSYFYRTGQRRPTRGFARWTSSHSTWNSTNNPGEAYLRFGQDKGAPYSGLQGSETYNNTKHATAFIPDTHWDLCNVTSGMTMVVDGKETTVTGTLDGTPGVSIDVRRVGDWIDEGGRSYQCVRAGGNLMTHYDTVEIQRGTVSGTPAGGSYTFTFPGLGTTSAITFGATAAQFETALRSVPGLETAVAYIGSGSTPNFQYEYYVAGYPGDLPTPTLNNSLTGGSSPTVTITTAQAGAGLTFNTAHNSYTQDGGLTWKQSLDCVPLTPPPTVAMPDAGPFIVVTINGPTMTVDTDLTTPGNQGFANSVDRTVGAGDAAGQVVRGLIYHNAARAARLAFTEARANKRNTSTVFVPRGRFPIHSSHGLDWDLDGAVDYTTTGGGNDNDVLFNYSVNAANENPIALEFGAHACMYWAPANLPGQLNSGTQSDNSIHFMQGVELNDFAITGAIGAQLNLQPFAAPRVQGHDSYCYATLISGTFTGNSQRASRCDLADMEFWGWPRLWARGGLSGQFGTLRAKNCAGDWGSAGHDPFTTGCENYDMDNCRWVACPGGERMASSWIYTDTNPPSAWLNIRNTLVLGSVHSIRCRAPRQSFLNNYFDECKIWVFESSSTDVTYSSNTFDNCSSIDFSANNLLGVGNRYINSYVNCSNGKQMHVGSIFNAYPQASVVTGIQLTGGSATWLGLRTTTQYADGSRQINVLGGSKHRISGWDHDHGTSAEAWQLRTTSTFCDDLWVSDASITTVGGPTGYSFESDEARLHFDNVDFYADVVTNDVAFDGQWIEASDCRFWCQVTVAAAHGGTAQAGAASTITLASGSEATVDNCYKSWRIYISSGAGAGQTNTILSNVASTRVCTMATNWSSNPDNTSVYVLMPPVSFALCKFMSTTADTFAVRGADFRDNDWTTNPTLPDRPYTSGNTIRGSGVTAVALSSNTADLLLPITDGITLSTTGTNNYNLSGCVACADGVVKRFRNTDSDTITLQHSTGSLTPNQFSNSSGADISATGGQSVWYQYAGEKFATER